MGSGQLIGSLVHLKKKMSIHIFVTHCVTSKSTSQKPQIHFLYALSSSPSTLRVHTTHTFLHIVEEASMV